MGWSTEVLSNLNEMEKHLIDFLFFSDVILNYGKIGGKSYFDRIKDSIVLLKTKKNETSIQNLNDLISLLSNLKKKTTQRSDIQQGIDKLNQLANQTISLMQKQVIAEAKTENSFELCDDLLKNVLCPQSSGPVEIEKHQDAEKFEFSYTSKTNPGKVITHNYQDNTVKAEGFDDNLEALLKTLKGLADERIKKNNQAKLTFQLTEPKSLTPAKLDEALTKAGYEKYKHSAFVEITLSPEIIARNATQPANQAPQQADSKSGELTFTTARTSRNQHSVEQGNKSHIGLHDDGLRFS